MTKYQKGLCGTFGCHKKANIKLEVIGFNNMLYCGECFIRMIGYMNEHILKGQSLESKIKLLDGKELFHFR